MTTEEAKTRLGRMVAATASPALDEADLDTLLAIAARVDRDGNEADSAAWEPTYDLNAAAAEGWRWKAAAASSCVDVSTDGTSLRRAQVYEHCLAMAAHYAARVAVDGVVVKTVDPAPLYDSGLLP